MVADRPAQGKSAMITFGPSADLDALVRYRASRAGHRHQTVLVIRRKQMIVCFDSLITGTLHLVWGHLQWNTENFHTC